MSKKYLKKNSKGAALVEYAIVLSCICAVGLSFTGDRLTGTLNGIFNKVNSTINMMLGTNEFSCIIRPLCTPNPRSGYRKSNKSVPPVRYCSTAS